MTYSYWTEEEKEMLIEAVNQNLSKHAGQRINWETIAEKVPSRTRDQCKSYYTNILKKKANITTYKYHQWKAADTQLLCQVAVEMQYNWKQIRDTYFTNMTAAQVSGKYHYIMKRNSAPVEPVKTDSEVTSEAIELKKEQIDSLADFLIGRIMAQ